MNISQKCNCCVCEPVCRWKEVYQNGVQSILNTLIKADKEDSFWKLKDCPHIEVSIKCPHMVTPPMAKRVLEPPKEGEKDA